tara:strand:+ start:7830 stop:9803 length:1974 start_codon:yes stop_codon:yes gene_type:complete
MNYNFHRLSKNSNDRLKYLKSLSFDSVVRECLSISILDKIKLFFSNQKTITKDKLRSMIIKQNPLPYYFNESTVSSYPGVFEKANYNLVNGVNIHGEQFNYKIPFPWRNNKSSRNIRYKIQSWVMYDSLLRADYNAFLSSKKDNKYIIPIIELISEWIDLYILEDNYCDEFSWYDMAVGQRATKLVYVMHRIIIDDNLFKQYFQFLSKFILTSEIHMLELMQKDKIAVHSNHGLFQMAGLLSLSKTFPIYRLSKDAKIFSISNIVKMLKEHFTSDGLHKEHSPEYHIYMANYLSTLIESQYIQDSDILDLCRKVVENSKWLYDPSEYLLAFGDTHNIQITKKANFINNMNSKDIKPPSGLKILKEGGLAICSNQVTSYLAFNAQFHSRQHKHADDLNFYLYDKGVPIIVDSGTYKYEYDDPKRIYIESTRAHNTIEIDDLNNSRLMHDRYGSCLIKALKFDKIFYFNAILKHKNLFQPNKSVFKQKTGDAVKVDIIQERKLFYIFKKLLIVYDTLSSDKTHKYTQWFHFDKDFSINQDSSNIICTNQDGEIITNIYSKSFGDNLIKEQIIKGEKSSNNFQGWVANSTGTELIPNYALGFGIKGKIGSFITIFDLDNSEQPTIDIQNNGKFIKYQNNELDLLINNDSIILNKNQYTVK